MCEIVPKELDKIADKIAIQDEVLVLHRTFCSREVAEVSVPIWTARGWKFKDIILNADRTATMIVYSDMPAL